MGKGNIAQLMVDMDLVIMSFNWEVKEEEKKEDKNLENKSDEDK